MRPQKTVTAESPFFSILIPSYNRPEFIAECIESILANEGEEFEIIISDDASPLSEAIEQAVHPYLDRPNIRFHTRTTNVGEPNNRNFLVSQARGQYNIILADDDRLLPCALRTIRYRIAEVPGQDLYLFGYQVVDASARHCYERIAPGPLAISLEEPRLVHRMLEATWLPFLICHPATFCCRKGVETAIPYRNDVSIADDYMFLLECLNKGKRLYVLPECMMQYRWAPSSAKQSNQSADKLKVMKARVKVYSAIQNQTDLHITLSQFVRSSRYRHRFLYDFIVRRTRGNAGSLDFLELSHHQRRELERYGGRFKWYLIVMRTPFSVAYELIQHFGIQGLLYTIRAGFAYFLFRVMPLVDVQASVLDCFGVGSSRWRGTG